MTSASPLADPVPQRHDVRLVVPALVGWLTALVAVAQPPAVRGGMLAVSLGVAGLATWRGARRGSGAHRARWQGPTAGVALAAVLAAAVVVSTAAQDAARSSPAVAAAVERGGSSEVTLRVTGLPRAIGPGPGGEPRVVVSATLLELRSADGVAAASTPVVLLAPAEWEAPTPGSRVRVQVRLRATEPGERAAAFAVALTAPVTIGEAPRGQRLGARLREGLQDAVATLPPHAAGLLPGIAVGDDSQVPPALADAMRASALGHLLAVSGAHVALLLGLVLAVAGSAPRGVRLALGAGVLVGLVGLVGAQPSVLRAAAMGGVALLAVVLGRRSSAIPAVAVAVAVLVLLDPWVAREPGLWLSVLATCGIVVWSGPWAQVLAPHLGPLGWLAPAVALPLAAQAACLPALLVLDPGLPTYGVLANALVAPVIPPITLLALTATVSAPVSPGLAHALVVLAQPGTWWIEQVATHLAAAPLARIPWPAPPGGLVLAGALVGAGVLCHRVLSRSALLRALAGRFAERVRRAAPLAVLTLAAGVGVLSVVPATRPVVVGLAAPAVPERAPPTWRVIACDVGQGSALLISTDEHGGGNRAVMVDVGGDDGAAVRCLDWAGVDTLSALVLTHADLDHVGGREDVLGAVTVEGVLAPVTPDPRMAGIASELAARGTPVRALDSTAPSLTVGELQLTVLWPTPRAVELAGAAADTEVANDLSLTLWVEAPDLTVLANGDLGASAQATLARGLPEGLDRPDVLVVPHHGSPDADDAALLRTAGHVSLVSVGADNDYGHPGPHVISVLQAAGSTVLRTDQCGTIAISAPLPATDTEGGLGVTGCP